MSEHTQVHWYRDAFSVIGDAWSDAWIFVALIYIARNDKYISSTLGKDEWTVFLLKRAVVEIGATAHLRSHRRGG